jgi:cytochrome c2
MYLAITVHWVSYIWRKAFKEAVVSTALSACIFGLYPLSISAQEVSGEQLYQDNCAVCHTIGGGRLVGPDLEGVHDRRSQQWLESFVKSSQSMVNSGDETAVALYEEYNNLPMPDPLVSELQIVEILQYMQIASAATGDDNNPAESIADSSAPEPAPPVPQEELVTEQDIVKGQDIFQGLVRLENGGPACNACHDVVNDAVIGGGILSVELTTVFSRLGGPAVRSIIGSAPFPVMRAAYLDKALTENEILFLTAFFQQADRDSAYQNPRDYGIGLAVSGVIGAGVLIAFYSLLWSRRKKDSVNQRIYDRQIKSS